MATDDPTIPLAAFLPDGGGDRLPVLRTVVRIGQGAQNDLVLDDDTVSTQHALLEYAGGGWKLTDLESTNGTWIDGERLPPRVSTGLRPDAEVAFGAYRATFVPEAGAAARAAAASAEPAPERTPLGERSGFRLPVWLLLLILLVVALLVTLFVVLGGDPAVTEPAVEPITALLSGMPHPAGP